MLGRTQEKVWAEFCWRTGAVVCQLADAVEAQVNNLLADGVVATGEVVGGILLATDELLRVEQLAVGAGADLVNHSGLQGTQAGIVQMTDDKTRTVDSSKGHLHMFTSVLLHRIMFCGIK